MATSTITIISGASSITLDNTVSTLTLGTSGPQGAPGEGVPIGGTAGQILQKDSATDFDTSWIDNFTTDVRVTVKNDSGSTLPKGTVVYVSGANGTNILVKPALATSDATSATTIGFLLQSLAANASGYVITQGTITGLDTSAGTAGDPVWLSPTVAGGVVYGVANKPQAPYHLYSLGVLTRSNANNGEIQVFVNNGWELEELHNVKITSPTNGQVLTYDSAQSLWVNSSETGDISAVTVTSPITGGGTSGSVNIGIDQTAITLAQSQVTNLTTDLAGKAALASANTFTVGGHTITSAAAATKGLIIKGAVGQSAALLDIQNDTATSLVFAKPITSNGAQFGFTSAYFERNGSTGLVTFVQQAVSGAGFLMQVGHASTVGTIIKGAASQTANLQEWQSSAGSILTRVTSAGRIYSPGFFTQASQGFLYEENAGGTLVLKRATAAAGRNGTDYLQLYVRTGTTAGTLKLVVSAGTAGAETTILDNIPQ